MTTYEWTLEEIEDGDIIDSDFSDTLTFPIDLATDLKYDLGLVRSEGNEIDGITDQLWAYVKGGNLPECFSNSLGQPLPAYKVPQRYHAELKKYLNN